MRCFAFMVTTLAFGALSPAFGQDAEVSQVGEDIVVFGGARDERGLLETPNAVTVVGPAEIQRRQASTYEELLGDIPGVTIGGGPRAISQEPNIRGFEDEQIVLRIDGARQNFNLTHRGRFFTDPEILQRVEVVRGSASSLFGSGALGGVILLETKDADDILDPEDVWGGRLKLGYNSQGDEFLGAATLAVQAGDFDALAFFSYRPMGSDLEDGGGNTVLNSELDSINGLVKLGYEPGDFRFEISYQRYEDEGLTPPNANAVSTPTTVVNRELSFQTGRAEILWQPDSDLFDVSALFYFNEADVTEDRPSDGRKDETRYTTYGFELVNRSDVDLGLPVQFTYGLEIYQDEQEALRNGAPRVQAPDATARYIAAFLQGDIKLSEQVTLTPGIRFDYFSVDPNRGFPDLSESEISPKLALQWRPDETTQLWISASQSFRAPSLTELYVDGVHFATFTPATNPFAPNFAFVNSFVPTPNLKPERSRSVEFGARYDERNVAWEGDRFTVSGNAYYGQVDDYIDTVVTGPNFATATFNPFTNTLTATGTTTNFNVDAVLWGVEAEMSYDAQDFFFGAGLTIPRGQIRNGGNLGSIPQDRLTFTAGIRPFADVEVGARATLLDGQDDVPVGSPTTGGTALIDLFASFAPTSGPLDGAFFSVGIDNVTDREYNIHPNVLNQPGRSFKASAGIEF